MEIDPQYWTRMFEGHSQMFSRGLLIDRMTDELAGDFVFVTAASRHFYHGALAAINNVQKLFPGRKIFFYDLENSSQPHYFAIRDRVYVCLRHGHGLG